MGELTDLFGNNPRVRSLEGLIRLAPVEFGPEDLAEEADFQRTNVYRYVEPLEEDGLIRTIDEDPQTFAVNASDYRIRILSILEAALELGYMGQEEAAVEKFSWSVRRQFGAIREADVGTTEGVTESQSSGNQLTLREEATAGEAGG